MSKCTYAASAVAKSGANIAMLNIDIGNAQKGYRSVRCGGVEREQLRSRQTDQSRKERREYMQVEVLGY